MRTRWTARLADAVLAGTVAAAVIGVGPAAAHVTVNPREAEQGGYAKLAFRVPNEKGTASTVKVEVVLPTDTPIASVSVKPTAGWTVAAEKAKLPAPVKTEDGELTEAASKITWTASGPDAAIKPGEFQEFEIFAGPLPKVDRIVFKALQSYSDNDIVRWIEEPAAGNEPEHPAPVLKLTATATHGGAGTPAAAPTNANANANLASSATTVDGRAGWALVLSIVALLAGLVGLGSGLLAPRRSTHPA